MSNIVLIGMPSSGKSTLGKQLAKQINYSFIDTDTLICNKFNMPLQKIVENLGFDTFNSLEGETGQNLICQNTVIATGGSMALIDNAMKNLKEIGYVVYLNVSLPILEKRLQSTINSRGISTAQPMTVKEIYDYRLPYYIKHANYILNCGNKLQLSIQILINELKNKNII